MTLKNITGVSEKNNTQGVSELEIIKNESEYHFENIVKNGYSIIKNAFSKKICETAKINIDKIYKHQIKEYGNEESLKSINENNLARALIVYDNFFSQFIKNKQIDDILKIAFGEKYILNLQNCPINRAQSKHFGSTWHRDLSYQHFIPSRPIAITTLICIDEFTEKNGGTCIVPFSHKFEKFPSQKYIDENEKKIEAKQGDILIFDSLLFHRAGENNTLNDRKLIVQVFTLPFIKQQISFPKALNGKFSDDNSLNYILGYETEVQDNVLEWRRRRRKRYDSIK
tara:strand:+ start:5448 stop:6299 length:852 start_codon:yes stop_codon:yes gene_type:complete